MQMTPLFPVPTPTLIKSQKPLRLTAHSSYIEEWADERGLAISAPKSAITLFSPQFTQFNTSCHSEQLLTTWKDSLYTIGVTFTSNAMHMSYLLLQWKIKYWMGKTNYSGFVIVGDFNMLNITGETETPSNELCKQFIECLRDNATHQWTN